MKTIYLFDEITGEYLVPYDAHESPMEPGVYIAPICSTDVAPPATDINQVAVFSAGAWVIRADYRAATVYDQSSGQIVVVTVIGDLAAGLTLTAPPPNFIAIKVQAAALIDATAGAARAKYITIAPGQEATYLLKAQQATAYKAAGYTGTVPGLVQAEIDATGATAQAAADDILVQEAAWAYIAGKVESARRRGKVAVANCANDEAAIAAAQNAAISELKLL